MVTAFARNSNRQGHILFGYAEEQKQKEERERRRAATSFTMNDSVKDIISV